MRNVPEFEPTVGAVETTEPSVILYMSVVLPALSRLSHARTIPQVSMPEFQCQRPSSATQESISVGMRRDTYPRIQILSSFDPKSEDQRELNATPMASTLSLIHTLLLS